MMDAPSTNSTQFPREKEHFDFLVPNGYLLIGHSESLNGLNIGLRRLKPSIYQKEQA